MHPNVHCNTIYNSQDMEVTQMPISRGMDKEHVVNIYNGVLLSHKKEQNSGIWSNMDTTRDYHTKRSQKQQNKHDTIYMWNLKYDANEPIYKTEIDSQT